MEGKSDTSPQISLPRTMPSNQSTHTFSGEPRALEPQPMPYLGQEANEDRGITRIQSTLKRVQTGLSFFNERLQGQRKSLVKKNLFIYALMGAGILTIFSIYWGSLYNRTSRMSNLRMVVVIEDDQTVNGTLPYLGNSLRQTFESREAADFGSWEIQNNSEFANLAQQNGHSVYGELQRQVHQQKYWAGVYLKANATLDLKNAILNGDSTYNLSQNAVSVFYETGRDMSAMNQYVIPNLQIMDKMFVTKQSEIISSIIKNINDTSVLSNPDALKLATSSLAFNYIDPRPVTDPVLAAPLQVGLIYMIIVTFFGFNFFGDVHREVIKSGVKKWHLLTYRVLASVCSFFVISLFFCLVTLVFQVDFTVAFGKSGFLVYWMTTFLTMCAVGSVNETMAMVCIIFYPPLMGIWLLFWVISNIAATFSPIALCPEFYRYTYAMPIHAAYEINKVIFFDTYKGVIGLNFAVIIIWAVMGLTAMAVVFFPFTRIARQRAMADRKRLEQDVLATQARDQEATIEFGK